METDRLYRVQKEDLPELAASCAELGGMLEHLRRMDLPHYYNIF